MIYSTEVQHMCPVAKGAYHGPAPIPEEGKWVQAKEIKDISGFTNGVGWCAPQQGACKLTLNVKEGVIQEALVETLGCSGMTHSAAMASERQETVKTFRGRRFQWIGRVCSEGRIFRQTDTIYLERDRMRNLPGREMWLCKGRIIPQNLRKL